MRPRQPRLLRGGGGGKMPTEHRGSSGLTYERSEAPNGATSTFYVGALLLPARQLYNRRGQWSCHWEHCTLQCGRAASRRLQELAVCVDSGRSRARIVARGRLATIVDEQDLWRGCYRPWERAAGRTDLELRVRTHGGVNDRCVRCE